MIFKVKDDGRGSNREYELKIADGTILDTDGITPIQTMNFEKIQKLQIGFAGYDPSILEHSTNSVELSVDSAYFANIKDKLTEFYVLDLPFKKPFNALWIRHAGDPNLSRINTNDRNISDYKVSEPEIGLSLFEFPPRAINQSTRISIAGHDLTTPIISSSSIHPITNLSDEVLSILKYPDIRQNDATSYNVAFPRQENKLLIFSLLFDRQWLSSSGINIPVHGFLNGYLLDEGLTINLSEESSPTRRDIQII